MIGYWVRGPDEDYSAVDPAAAADRELTRAREASPDGWPDDTERIGWAIVVDQVVETARGGGPCSYCGAEIGDPCGAETQDDAECDRDTTHDEYVEYELRQVDGLALRLATLLRERPQLRDLVVAALGLVGAP